MNHSVIYINKRAVSSKTNCETRYDPVFLRLFLVNVHSKTIPGSTGLITQNTIHNPI